MNKSLLNLVTRTALTVSALAGLAASAGATAPIQFPGNSSETRSPDGHFTVKSGDNHVGNIPGDKYKALPNGFHDTDVDSHVLTFCADENHKETVLKTYGRTVEVLWSPDSRSFIVNDYVGSDITVPYLYSVDDPAHPVNVSNRFSNLVSNKNDRTSLAHSLCNHVFCTKWIDAHSLEIKAIGNSRERGKQVYEPFTLVYDWDLRGHLKRIERM